ncbi:MAG TPA: helix-turn-helix domain-containing protein [Candidatus Sericytochromatia bacterium]|jgi:hypothetical protein
MSGLTPKQLEAIAGISRGLTPSQIGKALGISSRTIERWWKLPEFVATLTQIQSEVSHRVKVELVEDVTSISSRIENLASKSLDCLEQIIDNPEARNGDRIQAAKLLLNEWQRSQTPAMHELTAVEILPFTDVRPITRLYQRQYSRRSVRMSFKGSQRLFRF